jgi:DNA-binding CsgD family transcriptional regulator
MIRSAGDVRLETTPGYQAESQEMLFVSADVHAWHIRKATNKTKTRSTYKMSWTQQSKVKHSLVGWQMDAITALAQGGKSALEIAQFLNMPEETVRYFLRSRGNVEIPGQKPEVE